MKIDNIYKEFYLRNKMGKREWNNSGQITIFAIVAIVIVAAVILFFTVTDTGKKVIGNIFPGGEVNVRSQLQNCISGNKKVNEDIDLMLLQGGSLEPEFYYEYGDEKLSYLCYTGEYFDFCTMQQPLLIQHIEGEIESSAEDVVETCISDLKNDLKNRGYEVNSGEHSFEVDIVPESINVKIDFPLTIRKGATRNYKDFEAKFDKNIYELIMLTSSILNFEARYGDSDPVAYMALFPNFKIEKLKQGDGSTIYIITDRTSDDKIKFAVRSRVFMPGYVSP